MTKPLLRRAGTAVLGLLALLTAALVAQPAATAASSVPPAPTGLRVTAHDAVTAQLAWSSTEPQDGYTIFNVYADGILVYLTPATTATVHGLTPGSTVEFTVTVKRPDVGDRIGAESAHSAPVRVTLDADTTPPDVPSGLRLTGRTPEQLGFTWSTTQDDNGGAPRYELSFPGGSTVVDGYQTWGTVPLAGLDLSPGRSHRIELRAIDAAGNRSPAPATFVFETTPPGVATGLRQVSTRFGYPALIEWTAAPDNAAIMAYEIFLDGHSLGSTGSATPRVDLLEQVLNVGAPSGPANVQVRAVDTSFNTGALSAPLTVVFP
jgi:hypothetical protein